MIINAIDKDTGNGHIVVKGNRSASLRTNGYAVLLVILLCIISNAPLIIAGLWVPLVFTFVDITLLAFALWLTWKTCFYQDVIRLASDKVTIEQGRDFPERSWSWPRHWVRVHYSVKDAPMSLPEISIVSSGRGVRVASRANYPDRRRLLRILRRYLPCDKIPW